MSDSRFMQKSEPVHESNITSSGLDHTFRPICVTSSNRENRARIHRCHWHRAERWLSSSTKEWFERTVSMVMPCIRHISAIGCAMHSRNTWIVCARRSLLRQCAHLERRISRDQTAALLDHRTLLLHFICFFFFLDFPPLWSIMLRVAAGRLLVGLFFLGVLHSLEVVLPARAIDGECMIWYMYHHTTPTIQQLLPCIYPSSHQTAILWCVDTQLLSEPNINVSTVMRR